MTTLGDLNGGEAPNLEEMLQIAASTLKQGSREGATVLIQQVLEEDKRNDRAWVLLAAATTNPVDRRRYLRTALHINPNNQAAQRALQKMKKAQVSSENQALWYGSIGLAIVLVIAAIACVLVFIMG